MDTYEFILPVEIFLQTIEKNYKITATKIQNWLNLNSIFQNVYMSM